MEDGGVTFLKLWNRLRHFTKFYINNIGQFKVQKNTQLTTNSQESVETQVLFFIVKNPVVFTLLLIIVNQRGFLR